MPYSDYLNAIGSYGSYYNQGSAYINPYSSAGYVGSTATRASSPVDPRSQFTDYSPSGMDRLATGAMGYQMGAGVSKAVPGMMGGIMQKSYGPLVTKGSGMLLTGAGALYGATRNQNPYDYTPAEKWGTIGAGAMAGAGIGKYFGGPGMLVGAILGGLGGWATSGSQKRKAEEMNLEAEEEYTEARAEYLGDIAKEREESRDYALSMTEAGQWASESQKYDNQYGAYANPYGTSYMDEGGKLTKKEIKKVQSLGRRGDTELAHVNPQEKAMLKAMGGSGRTNPLTGLPEYHYKGFNPFNQHNVNHALEIFDPQSAQEVVSSVFDPTHEGGVTHGINQWSTGSTPSDYEWADSSNWMGMAEEAGWLGQKPSETPVTLPRVERGTQEIVSDRATKDSKVVAPFRRGINIRDKTQSSVSQLEDYRWDLENPYIRENVDIFDDGGKLTKKELKKVKNLGRRGDTELAHVNPQEKAMLKSMGGSGGINPLTGLPEYDGGHTPKGMEHIPHEEGDPITHIVGAPTPSLSGNQNVPSGTPMTQSQFDEYYNDRSYDIWGGRQLYMLGNAASNFWDYASSGEMTSDMWDSFTDQGEYADKTDEKTTIPRIERGTRDLRRLGASSKDQFNVVNPFSGTGSGQDKSSSTSGLEGYRWNLENPYIRENVDIFDDGGVVNDPESLPMDSMLNRQLFTESSFKPSAESPKGALGLSQITKDTFNDMIGWGWVPEGKKFSDLKTDTNLSVNLQEKYMSDLMSREWNTGSEEVVKAKALAAYNMGPTGLVNKLNKLKADGKDIYNNLDWINSLSKETRNYVNKIMKGGGEKFEREYTEAWKAGGKDYAQGGQMNTIAEFTGNELIVNNQNEVEAGLAANDFKRAAAPIREAMNKGYLTPGDETHQGNPMPVSGQGVIYAGGGELPFKVRQGAGIYDHATDQFNSKMSDKQIAMVAQKNINKWQSNNMA